MAERSQEDEPLEVFWDALKSVRRETQEPESTVPKFGDLAEADDLVIGTNKNRILVIIKPTGEVLFGPEYRPTEAAQVFWEHMGQQRIAMEEKFLIIRHMEAILVQLGQADLQCERLRRAAVDEPDRLQRAALEQAGERAMQRLSQIAGQAIELGRGLVRRPEVAPPEMPAAVPRTLQENPVTDYQGREGIPPEESFPDYGDDEEPN